MNIINVLLIISNFLCNYVISESTKLDFVSTVCGMGAYWDPSQQICVYVPDTDNNNLNIVGPKPSQSAKDNKGSSKDNKIAYGKLTLPKMALEHEGDTREDHYDEQTSWEVVAVECGIGYTYNFKTHTCQRKYILTKNQ